MRLQDPIIDIRSITESGTFDSLIREVLKLGTSTLQDRRILADWPRISAEQRLEVRQIVYFAALAEFFVYRYDLFVDRDFRALMNRNRDLVSEAPQKYDSVEDFQRSLDSQSQMLVKRLEDISLQHRSSLLVIGLTNVTQSLLSDKWLTLAKTPRRFNKELNKDFNAIKRAMKELYGVPSHRAAVKISRDREIWLLKKKGPSLSFGQIGQKFGISDGAAELAYKRQVRREGVRLKKLKETATVINEILSGKLYVMSL